jgi:segregation and condensation protein B
VRKSEEQELQEANESNQSEEQEEEIKPLTETELVKNESLVEAALFISGRYIALHELVSLTNINPISLKEIIESLKKRHDDSGAITIIEREDRYKMDVKPEFHILINKLALGKHEFTKAEQETLAIIAYKNPLTQSVVVKIRGNKAYDHIKHLREVGLVASRKKGNTLELSLGETFYDYFSLDEKKIKKK